MKVLNWNIRGLNAPKKRRALRDIISSNKIDVIAIQETKKETFTHRILKSISSKFDNWFSLPSRGRSGGILIGCDSDTCQVVRYVAHTYSIDVFLYDRKDSCNWMLTVVYAPVDRNLKAAFWQELRNSRMDRTEP